MTLTQLFTNIANAIRGKKGTSELIKAEDFADEITNLPSGGKIVVPTGMRFKGSTALPIDFSNFDFSQCTNFNTMFQSCTFTQNLIFNDTSNGTDFKNFLQDCPNFEYIYGEIDISNSTDCSNMFYGCDSLKSLTLRYNLTSNRSVMKSSLVRDCENLEDLNIIIEGNYTDSGNLNNAFSGCTSLSNTSLDNILNFLSYCTPLYRTTTKIGLDSKYNDILPTLPHYQAFLDAGWKIQ